MSTLDHLKELEERFLGAEEPTGKDQFDGKATDTDLPEDEFEEVQMMMRIVESSVKNTLMCIESMMRRGHQDKLVAMYGEDAKDLLAETQGCLGSVAELFESLGEEEEAAEEPEETAEEPEQAEEVPAEEPAEKPADEPAAAEGEAQV